MQRTGKTHSLSGSGAVLKADSDPRLRSELNCFPCCRREHHSSSAPFSPSIATAAYLCNLLKPQIQDLFPSNLQFSSWSDYTTVLDVRVAPPHVRWGTMATTLQPCSVLLREPAESFNRTSLLNEKELNELRQTSFHDLQKYLAILQKEQQKAKQMMHMKRLSPFLDAMQRYTRVIELTGDRSNCIAYVWVYSAHGSRP